ncbi:ABC transporter permease [Thermus islandicus]|uniref:ABC transporter permease n=1 Tax=Thermus islandicus TaxID=540988 RepID=UPI0003B61339|nr:ABC transporter permease [Thermus islandicus]
MRGRFFKRFFRNRLAWLGLLLVSAYFLVALFAPLIAPPRPVGNNCLRDLGAKATAEVYDPLGPVFWRALLATPASCYQIARINYRPEPSPPLGPVETEVGVVRPLLGTSSGYDVFYGLVWGTRTALRLALVVVALQFLVGVVVGAVSGYFGGVVDNVIQRVLEVIFAFPSFVLIMVITTLLGPSLEHIILAFVLVGWAGYARVVRGEVLRVRALDFVEAARAMGASHTRIIVRHILPNSLTAATVVAVLDLGSVPLSAAALSFLGIGLPVGYADWGQLVAFARSWIQGPPGNPLGYWYVSFFPALTIVLFGLGWNLLGDAVRDALDPRSP